jgi:hypothetical protein
MSSATLDVEADQSDALALVVVVPPPDTLVPPPDTLALVAVVPPPETLALVDVVPSPALPDCASLSSTTKYLQPGMLVQIDCDQALALDTSLGQAAARKLSGFWGTIAPAACSKSNAVCVVPGTGAVGNKKIVPLTWLVPIKEEPAPPSSWKKNVLWLSKEQMEAITKYYLPIPLDGSVPGPQTRLSEAEMSLGCVEIGWRLLIPGCVVAPPHLCALVAHHIMNHDCLHDRYQEGETLCEELLQYAATASLLFAPIICSGHWTLLVLERSGEDVVAEGVDKPPPSASGIGCPKCVYNATGCKDCDPAAAYKWYSRVEKEMNILAPLESSSVKKTSTWSFVRYYDSLPTASSSCAEAAHALLDCLQGNGVHTAMTAEDLRSARANRTTQTDATSCGWHVLHFIETEMRRFRGEGQWSFVFDLGQRVGQLRRILARFQSWKSIHDADAMGVQLPRHNFSDRRCRNYIL